MIAALIILLIISGGGKDAMRVFEPEKAKSKIVKQIKDPARAAAASKELDDQIAVYRAKSIELAAQERKLADLLVVPETTKEQFISAVDSFDAEMAKFDLQLIEERNAMKQHMTEPEWRKAFGAKKKKK